VSQASSITGAVSFGLQRGLTNAINRERGRLRVWRACSTLTIQLAAVDGVAAGYVLQYGDIFDAHDLAWSSASTPLDLPFGTLTATNSFQVVDRLRRKIRADLLFLYRKR
jgi:hypothetical protein